MTTYRLSDEYYSETIEADSMDEAKERAAASWRAGSWDDKCLVAVCICELDDDGDVVDSDSIEVECGDDPEPPECTCEDGHDWVRPVEVVGGCTENPGVWSTGGTSMVFLSVCTHCGCYKRETSYGTQRNPGQCDSIEYLDPDDSSLAWIAANAE